MEGLVISVDQFNPPIYGVDLEALFDQETTA